MSDCKYQHTSRAGLYIMVFLILFTVLGIGSVIKELNTKIDNLKAAVDLIKK